MLSGVLFGSVFLWY